MQRTLFNIPDKNAFRPEEVVRLTRLDTRVLTFWAKEFSGIKPSEASDGSLVYSREKLERILTIKKLLIEERLDKATVRERLQETVQEPVVASAAPVEAQIPPGRKVTLAQIKQGLKEILTILDRDARI